jgi:MFS family permease
MSALTPLATRRRETSHESGQAPSARLHRRGFWLVGYVFLVTMAFSTVPTPLYVLYGARDHFGPLMVTVIFAAYAVGVVASLFLAGHLSDWLGRRRMALTAVAVNLAAGLIFLLWPTVPGLLLARVVTGVSIGMMTATATAFLSELDAAAHGGLPRRRAEIAATAANLGGLGVGPLVSGFLAQYAGDPLQVPYLVFEALMLLAMLALALVPETVQRPLVRPRYRPQRVSVPAEQRPAFYAAGAVAATAFALVGLFTSLAPGFIAGTLHHPSHALAGFAVFAVFGAAALTQIAVSRATLRGQLAFGFSLLILGLVMVTAAVWAASLLLLILGGVIAGCGVGAAFRGSVSTVLAIAAPGARGEALAGLFLGAYLGLAIPVVALGVATQLLSVRDAVLGFAVVLAAVVALVSRRLLSRPHEASPANASPANASTADASTAKASAGEPAQWGQPSSVRRAS